MTKTIVVNCNLAATSKIQEVLSAVGEFSDCTLVGFQHVSDDFEIKPDVDAVVLSGSLARIVDPNHRDMFKGVVSLIRRLRLPLLGICFGHQILCWSLGAKVNSFEAPVKKFEDVRLICDDELFEGFGMNQTILLAESHYDYVVKASLEKAGFELLADSKSCEVEAVKHRTKPFYGVQFHPERFKIDSEKHTEGLGVIRNFYQNIVKR